MTAEKDPRIAQARAALTVVGIFWAAIGGIAIGMALR